MPSPHNYTYQTAREAFLSRINGSQQITYQHPEQGPDGDIAMDVAFWEAPQSKDVLVISSGTHGVEGYCGSFIQCALLDEGLAARTSKNMSLMMIHGVNPYGFAWQRRVNENNVDLNRNFIDHTKPHPQNRGYQELASVVEPIDWTPDTSTSIISELLELSRQHPDDPRWLQAALSGGQYEFPGGQFYGGVEPQWSNEHIQALVKTHLMGRRVIWIDIHTALGDYGTAQCIVELDPASELLTRAEALWGERVVNMGSADSVSVAVAGSMISSAQAWSDREMLGQGLEYGTVNTLEVVQSLIQDQWLHRYGDVNSPLGTQTKQRMMDAFYPDDAAWRTSVLNIAREVVDAVIERGFD
ncbi:MAG: M14 family metallopeptidase [Pseudomonadaceae bacterium]|nr:M14 family metallopeptidase [Pseudomonadaceae bacterium]